MIQDPVALVARRLTKLFGNRVVLNRIDLELAAGQIVALTGANGAGKSTLLRCLAGLLRPNSGEIRRSVRQHPSAACPSNEWRMLVGFVSHEACLYPHLTARENLLFAARMYGLPSAAELADQWLNSLRLESHAHRRSSQLSKGMRQRLALARAILHDPPIVLMDEPFSGLDADSTAWLEGLLLELRGRDRCICFSTHDHQKARTLADRVLCLRSARIEELSADRIVSLPQLSARAA